MKIYHNGKPLKEWDRLFDVIPQNGSVSADIEIENNSFRPVTLFRLDTELPIQVNLPESLAPGEKYKMKMSISWEDFINMEKPDGGIRLKWKETNETI